MPVRCRMFQQTLDGSAWGWFERLPHDSINEWAELRDAFAVRKVDGGNGFYHGCPGGHVIFTFMDLVKSPELAKRFSDKVPTMVNEKTSIPFNGRDVWPFRNTRLGESRRDEYRNSYRGRDAYRANRTRDDRAPYLPPRGEYNRRIAPVLTLNSLTKHPK
ncbi:hypothetical protein Tco_1257413 [Tanacetum coccineum]